MLGNCLVHDVLQSRSGVCMQRRSLPGNGHQTPLHQPWRLDSCNHSLTHSQWWPEKECTQGCRKRAPTHLACQEELREALPDDGLAEGPGVQLREQLRGHLALALLAVQRQQHRLVRRMHAVRTFQIKVDT